MRFRQSLAAGFGLWILLLVVECGIAVAEQQSLDVRMVDLHEFRQSIGLHTNMSRGDYQPTAESVRLIAAAGVRVFVIP